MADEIRIDIDIKSTPIVKKVVVGAPIRSVHTSTDVSLFDNGDVSGTFIIDYSLGQFQKMNVVGDITSLNVINWPSSTTLGRLALYITLSTTYNIDWSWITGWAASPSAPVLDATLNELIFTTVDGGSVVIGHGIALGI